MITNANKGTYLVKNGQKHDNVIYERPLTVDCLHLALNDIFIAQLFLASWNLVV